MVPTPSGAHGYPQSISTGLLESLVLYSFAPDSNAASRVIGLNADPGCLFAWVDLLNWLRKKLNPPDIARTSPEKGSITIIAPLGVDLNTQLALRFNGTGQINVNWTTCEQIGCLVYLTDNSKDEKMINLYKKIYDSLNKSQSLEIAVKALVGNQPIAVQSNLNGFNAAAKKLDSEKSS